MITDITTNAGGETLSITWDDGAQSHLPAAHLRANARDAWTKRELIDTGAVAIAPGLAIEDIQPVGSFGVNLRFSDGHDKAVFPFVYLRELSSASEIETAISAPRDN